MSRGPGAFQRDVLARIRRDGAGGFMAWDMLKEQFPLRLADRSLHRAVRGLKRMSYLRETTVNGRRWVAVCSPGMNKADRELLDLCSTAAKQLRLVAKARGATVPDEAAVLEESVDAYRRVLLPSD